MRVPPEAFRCTQNNSCWGVHRALGLQRPRHVGVIAEVWIGLGMAEQLFSDAASADRDLRDRLNPPVDTGMVAVYRLAGVI